MTRKRPGQNLGSRKAADAPTHKTSSVAKDGPEEYTEDASIKGPEDGKSKAPSANSADKSSASKSKNHKKQTFVTGELGPIKETLGLRPSRFGSPFAYSAYQNKHDFFKGLLAKSTRVLFDPVVAEASSLRSRLLPGVALTNDGSNGLFCGLKKSESLDTDSNSGEENNSDGSNLALYGFEPGQNRLRLALFVDPTSTAVHWTHVVREVLVDFTSSSDSSSTKSGNAKADKFIDVRRVRNSNSGEFEYFILNIGLDFLSINGIKVDPSGRAGPLPNFAVFELGRSSLFWWRTGAALDYMPNLKRKRESEDDDEDSSKSSKKACEGDTDPPFNSQVFPESKNWLEEYRRRFKLCEARSIAHTSSSTDLHPPHQLPDGEMRNIDVVLAIGAVWLSLIRANIDFAYAYSDLFSFARDERMVGLYAVKGSNHFIMPLLFKEKLQALSRELEKDTAKPLEPVFSVFQRGEEKKNEGKFSTAEKAKQKDSSDKNKPPLSLEDKEAQSQSHKDDIGHFVLAIAERINRDNYSTLKDSLKKRTPVRLRFMDSAQGIVDRTMIRYAARNIIRHSGWLGDTWPSFDANDEHWTEVLRHSGNRSGEHTVMNAWAYMLEIRLARKREKSLGHKSYEDVRRMIHLALRGQLDSLTIRAWMQHSKYAVDEPLSQLQQSQKQNISPSQLRSMQTVALNEDTFNEEIREMHIQEQVYKQNFATLLGAVSVPQDGSTTQQSGHALPTSDQGPVAGPSGSSTGSATVPSMLQASHSSPRSWQQKLDQGLAYHRNLQARNPRTTEDTRKPASFIPHSSDMADYDVVLGIAPIWEGLKRLGRAEYDFAYAGMDVFADPGMDAFADAGMDVFAAGGPQDRVGAVGGWSRFIMPLFLSSTRYEEIANQGKGKNKSNRVGHLLLCVAELVSDQPMTVQIKVFNSAPRYGSHQDIMERVQAIIRDSGWLGVDYAVTEVRYRHCLGIPVPLQVGVNTCGLHVIFNAWATMLGIPIHHENMRRGLYPRNDNDAIDTEFLQQGLEIINLALGGFMDSRTIQAFFNVYGYSVEQRFGDPANSVVRVNAIGMNQEKLRLTLQKRYWNSILESADDREANFSGADIAFLTDLGSNVDQARRALTISGGNRADAAEWYFRQDPEGELPRPEEALSPKTPDRGGSWF